jgi:hypothetical protein
LGTECFQNQRNQAICGVRKKRKRDEKESFGDIRDIVFGDFDNRCMGSVFGSQ